MSEERAIPWLTMPERITGLYSQAGHTRESFAAAAHMSSETLGHFENFLDVPTLIELGELANGLHVSKRFLCFGDGELQVGNRGEPALSEDGVRAVFAEVNASEREASVFYDYRQRVSEKSSSRTFVLMFVRALRAAIESGAGTDAAMPRAMVIATQAHVLSLAVAQGARPVRTHLLTKPPKHLSTSAVAQYIAAEIHKLSGLKPPIDAMVLAVVMGRRLVPTIGDSAASKAESDRQDQMAWKPIAHVDRDGDGDALIINGRLKVKSWEHSGPKLTDEVVLEAARNLQPEPDEPAGFGGAFLQGKGQFAFATPTELGRKGDDWVRTALRDLARRMDATAIYVISDELISVCAPRGSGQQRRTVIVDVENPQAVPSRRTYVASTGDEGTLGDWSEDSTRARYRDLLPVPDFVRSDLLTGV